MFGLDLIFPSEVKCIFCGGETKDYGICEECYATLPFISGDTCHHCGGRIIGQGNSCIECKNKKFYIDHGYAILDYAGDISQKIASFKEKGSKYIGYAFAHLIEEKYNEMNEDVDIIVPVPIGEKRLKERGYNQSEVLCTELIPSGKVKVDILLRPKDTLHQTGLDRKHRETNLKGAFKISDKKLVKDKCILIVDDIYTTGSTINECAKALKEAGAKRVIGLTLCRTPVDRKRLIR